MNPMFNVFNVSKGDREWKHALFIGGKWFAFNWEWYCDTANETKMASPRTKLSTWDDCIIGEIPAADVQYVTPEYDRDSGPFYTHMHPDWIKEKLGITIPD